MASGLTYESLNRLPLWQKMTPITLEEMRGVKLMNRIDTKYILCSEQVLTLLHKASEQGYRIQVIGDAYATRYDTLYYDTPARDMYVAHHNQHLSRQKIRTRHYVDNNQTFLEVKDKSNRGRTNKRRTTIAHHSFADILGDIEAVAYLEGRCRYDIRSLSPALSTRFVRMTLVNASRSERVTIDLDLHYEDMRSRRAAEIRDMAIVEVKQDGNCHSHIKDILQMLRIMPFKVSKYCLGTALTVEGIKKNRMKQKLRDIEKRIGYGRVHLTRHNI